MTYNLRKEATRLASHWNSQYPSAQYESDGPEIPGFVIELRQVGSLNWKDLFVYRQPYAQYLHINVGVDSAGNVLGLHPEGIRFFFFPPKYPHQYYVVKYVPSEQNPSAAIISEITHAQAGSRTNRPIQVYRPGESLDALMEHLPIPTSVDWFATFRMFIEGRQENVDGTYTPLTSSMIHEAPLIPFESPQ